MQVNIITFITTWRTLLLLALLPALTNCSKIEGSAELRSSTGDAYSFEGAKVEAYDLNAAAVSTGQVKSQKGAGSVTDADGTISLQVITATISDNALYDVEIRCPANNTADACNVDSPLHLVLSGAQLKAGGWKATALTDAAFHNTAYYVAAAYPTGDIQQMLDNYANALLAEPSSYGDLLAWDPTLTDAVRRPETLGSFSEALAQGGSDGDIKLLAREWVTATPSIVTEPVVLSGSLALEGGAPGNVSTAGNYAYLQNAGIEDSPGFLIIDANNPVTPTLVTNALPERYLSSAVVSGNYAFLGDHQWGALRVADISNLAEPVAIEEASIYFDEGHEELWGVRNIVLSANYVYVPWGNGVDSGGGNGGGCTSPDPESGRIGGVFAVDVSTPTAPVVASHICVPDAALAVAVAGTHAYVSLGGDGALQVVDFSDVTQPVLAGNVALAAPANFIALSGNYAWAAEGANGIEIIDISNPAAPVVVYSINTPGYADHIVFDGSHVYVADRASGVLIFDNTNPIAPVLASSANTSSTAYSVFIIGDYLYAGTGYGIEVLKVL